MINGTGKKDKEMAAQLIKAQDALKKAEAAKDEAREYFIERTRQGAEAIKVGSTLIMFEERSRSTLDREALEKKFGSDVIAAFLKVTEYLSIKTKQEKAS
jgi:hypothetical protein